MSQNGSDDGYDQKKEKSKFLLSVKERHERQISKDDIDDQHVSYKSHR